MKLLGLRDGAEMKQPLMSIDFGRVTEGVDDQEEHGLAIEIYGRDEEFSREFSEDQLSIAMVSVAGVLLVLAEEMMERAAMQHHDPDLLGASVQVAAAAKLMAGPATAGMRTVADAIGYKFIGKSNPHMIPKAKGKVN